MCHSGKVSELLDEILDLNINGHLCGVGICPRFPMLYAVHLRSCLDSFILPVQRTPCHVSLFYLSLLIGIKEQHKCILQAFLCWFRH